MTQEEFDREFLKLLSKSIFFIRTICGKNILYINLNNKAFCNFKYKIDDDIIYEFWLSNSKLRALIPIGPNTPTTVYVEFLHNIIHKIFNQRDINIVC